MALGALYSLPIYSKAATTTTGTTGATDYNVNPAPQPGKGPYGAVPGAIGIPPNIYSQVSNLYPNLGGQLGQVSANIGSELAGQLSPETINAIKDQAASFGVTSGMPGSQFAGFQGLRNLGLNVESFQRQGLTDYMSALSGVGSTMTQPSLAAEIAQRNATMAAAPDPAAAAAEQQRLFDKYLEKTQSPAGGTMRGNAYTGTNRMYTGNEGITPVDQNLNPLGSAYSMIPF